MGFDDVVQVGTSRVAIRRFRAIGTVVTVATTDVAAGALAEALLRLQLDELDRAASRFRPDSELAALHSAAGARVELSALLAEAFRVALEVARLTEGAVDPTIGAALADLGYDQDFDEVRRLGPRPIRQPVPAPGWQAIAFDAASRTVRLPPGVSVDLGASAKALAADRAAETIAGRLGAGVLVNLGGDVAVAGPPPPGGWPIGLAVRADADLEEVEETVALSGGGLATSSSLVRVWRRGAGSAHHIIDPSSGDCARSSVVLATVVAPGCVEANAWSTGAIVWGEEAERRLRDRHCTARLRFMDGRVTRLGGFPESGPRPTSDVAA